ncbi:hypothetical protein IL252_14555 (plasmid) [Halomicrobium sp. IBSBa]|uniref:hypothetical protein n=1 Tax=Halomicrobium sp. IBSBa TaxID=2778916 RepID=UPI001ABF8235|nr:hypothetical protein [Halomicrobium sp. IBSBa]MBO4249038.1 hypothetical protein [Halomicrobium sp. IBSBa]
MARWHLSFDRNSDERAYEVCEKAGLQVTGAKKENRYYLRTYGKRAIDNVNFIDFGDDWICVAGTIISNGSLGEAALKDFYDKFVGEGLAAARESVIGHYAIAIQHDGQITAFTDPHGAYRLYYSTSHPVVTNSLHVAAELIPTSAVEQMGVLAHSAQPRSTGEQTLFNDIKRLYGSQLLKMDPESGVVSSESLDLGIDSVGGYNSVEEAVERYQLRVDDVFSHFDGIDSLAVSATGGLDSRTILASLFQQGIKPQIVYGVGNSKLTNTKRRDREVAAQLASRFNLPFYEMDWSGDHPHSQEKMQEGFQQYGFKYTTYGLPEALISEMNGGITPYPDLQISGYGPTFTNSKIWARDDDPYSFEDLVEDYIRDFATEPMFNCYPEYHRYIEESIRSALDHSPVEYPDQGASLATFAQTKMFLKVRIAAGGVNFFNEFGYYIAPFLMKRLHDPLLNVPMKYREKDTFQIRMIENMEPSLLDIPLYSGTKPATVDRRSQTMQRPRKYRIKNGLIQVAGAVLPQSIKPKAKDLYLRMTADPGDNMTVNDLIRVSGSEFVLSNRLVGDCFENSDCLTLRDLNRLHRNLVGIHSVQNEDDPVV